VTAPPMPVARLGAACLLLSLGTPALAAATTLDAVRQAGKLACGVVSEPEDWTKTDLHRGLAPLGVEICKAVAVAALGEAAKVDVHPYASEREAGEGLKKGDVALALGMTASATAMWQWQIGFGPPVFYDGQSILMRGDAHVATPADLAGLRICFIEGTDNERVLLARTVARKVAIVPLPFQEEGEMDDAMAARHCDAVSAYVSKLAVLRAAYPKQLGGDVILPDLLTLAPVAPSYRQGDAQWGRLVDWTIYALIQAEASGVTRTNVDAMHKSEDPVVQRLLGEDWGAARALGLQDHGWAGTVISVVGNYGEIYDRTVGVHGALHLARGLNALWTQGGLLHPLPVE
jgi:general L-amino acid transport system substrate-binding protein